MEITNNKIIRNSWDGIALYRNSKAKIFKNIIDGVDKAASRIAGGGRGVGIGVTWNGEAFIEGNIVKGYWKGIGIFVDANAVVRYNIIEDVLTWGIAIWDADRGIPIGFIENNIIFSTGACGTTITRSLPGTNPGYFIGNILVNTAQNPKYDSPDYYCHQCALSIFSKPEEFIIKDNIFYGNRRATDDLPDYDLSKEKFINSISYINNKFRENKFFTESEFYNYLDEFR